MGIKEFYDVIGGNYDEVMGRLMKEERVEKFVRKFAASEDYNNMVAAIEGNNAKDAFLHSHSLKGVALNLAFTKLAGSASALCEMYRNGEPEADVTELFEKVKADYKETMDAIAQL